MKRTTRILTALALLCGAITVATPAVAQDFASDTENYLATNVRIESIAITDTEPVAAGETVTFEVTLADTGTNPVTLQSATFTGADKTQLPYLKLNIPFRGTSTPLEGVSVTTDTAAAFFKGSRQQGRNLVLQFEYTVRYGDLASALNWAGTTPSFGGNIAGISVQAYRGIEFPSAVSLSQSSLVPKAGGITKPVDTPSVCGYDVRIGGVFDPTSNASLDYSGGLTERLFPGVVPVTVSIPAGVSVATPGTGAPAGFFQAWVKRGDNYLAVGVTPSTSANFVAAKDPVDPSPAVTDFMGAYDAKLTASAAPLLTAGSSATYYLNIPASLYNTGASSEALTFGFGYGDGDGAGTFSGASLSKTFNMTAQLIQDGSSYALSGSVAPATLTSDGTATNVTINGQAYPVSEAIATDAQVWVASLAAGESLTFQAYKSDSENYETAGGYYAGWTRVSTATNRAAFSSPVVRFAGNSTTAVTITAPDTASGDAIFRLSSPGLDDKPIYLLVQVSVPRAQITLTPAGSSSGTEYVMTPAIDDGAGTVTDGSGNILKYTLSLSAPVTATTYFRVAPTFSDGTLIAAGAMLTNGAGETIDAYDLFASFATLSTGRGYSDADPACTLTIPAGSSTADFYVTLHNDFPRTGDLPAGLEGTGPNAGKTITRLAFSARTATSTGAVVGTNDICNELVPMIMNQAPTISSFSAPSNGSASNVALTFSFNILDAPGDYLVAEMNFGEGENVVKVLVDQTKMIAILGETKWKQIVADLGNRYPSLADAITAEGLFDVNSELVIERKDALSVVSFSHAYNTTTANWSLTVRDSTSGYAAQNGTLTLATSQRFTAYTYDKNTGGLGTVAWVNGTAVSVWEFGTDYMYSGLARSSNTTATIRAIPYAAGEADGYTDVTNSATLDSFFYEWTAEDKYAGVLSTNENRYKQTVVISRNFVGADGSGGDASNPNSWADIVLSARFVREYLSGDYNAAAAANVAAAWPAQTTEEPYLLSLGDYNRDGVPDGWILNTLGEDGRDMVTTALAGTGAENDRLPSVGWAAGDAVYRNDGASGSVAGSFALEGSVYDYATRLRGRDAALNAATGKINGDLRGEWISAPQWVVRIRPDFSVGGTVVAGIADAGSLNEREGDFPLWSESALRTVRLQSTAFLADGVTGGVAQTSGFRSLYYYTGALDTNLAAFLGDGAGKWHYLIDENGYPIKAGMTRASGALVYGSANVLVHEDTEEILYLYAGWGYHRYNTKGDIIASVTVDDADAPGLSNPVIYPFHTADLTAGSLKLVAADFGEGAPDPVPDVLRPVDAIAAYKTEPVIPGADGTEIFGIEIPEKTRYPDAKASCGQLLDEPFRAEANGQGFIDPRLTSWLDRANTSSDQDGDGLTNAIEYYFWYYASRIAYAPVQITQAYTYTVDPGGAVVFTKRQGEYTDAVLDSGVWPAIDMTERRGSNAQLYEGASAFALGRRFRLQFDPRLDYGLEGGNNPYGDGDATHCKGNFWEPISVDTVLAAFNPLVAGAIGDIDNDGLGTVEELAIGTNPIDCDTDNDYLPDGWEVAMELDPTSALDGLSNDDNDYFAVAIVEEYPEAKTVYTFNYATSYKDSLGVDKEYVAPADWVDGSASVTYLEDPAEAGLSTGIGERVTMVQTYDRERIRDTKAADAAVRYELQASRLRMLRDHEVYQAFGFDPMTAWISTGESPEIGRRFSARNTRPFTAREEFFSGIIRAQGEANYDAVDDIVRWSTNPKSADTNGDGIPDGWTLYTTGNRYDNVSPAGEAGDKTLLGDSDDDGLTGVQEFSNVLFAEHRPEGWTNKLLPSDPNNPDTDFDGLWDGDEGGTLLIAAGGGTDPTAMDTDGDGMPDAWEYRWFKGTDTASPNPLNPNDGGLDYDRDGLTNYQEYLTAFLRQNRYDLGTDAARLYKDRIGRQTWSDELGDYAWEKVADLPDAYTAVADLGNPGLVRSSDYSAVLYDEDDGFFEPMYVHPLAQAMAENAAMFSGSNELPISWSVSDALGRLWNRTLLFPAADDPLSANFSAEDEELIRLNEALNVAVSTYVDLVSEYVNVNGAVDVTRYALQNRILGQTYGVGTPESSPSFDPASVTDLAAKANINAKFAALADAFTAYNEYVADYRDPSELEGYDAASEAIMQLTHLYAAIMAEANQDTGLRGLGGLMVTSAAGPIEMNAWNVAENVRIRAAVATTAVNQAMALNIETIRNNAEYLDCALNRAFTGGSMDDVRTALYYVRKITDDLATFRRMVNQQGSPDNGKVYYPPFQGWIKDWAGTEGEGLDKVWKARRAQIVRALHDHGLTDTAYVDFVNNLYTDRGVTVEIASGAAAGLTPEDLNEGDTAILTAPGILEGYEEAVRTSEAPFVLSAYRQAIRGFNGGLWTQPTRADYANGRDLDRSVFAGAVISDLWMIGSDNRSACQYVMMAAPLGYHRPILPFAPVENATSENARTGRRELAATSPDTPLFGLPMQTRPDRGAGTNITTSILVGGRLPMTVNGRSRTDVVGYQDAFATTSPTASDTDLDGMDDYWEVFHGLNPILGAASEDDSEYNGTLATGSNYDEDRIYTAYRTVSSTVDAGAALPYVRAVGDNPFGNPTLRSGSVTTYNYFAYPWMAGMPDADPDGDGLTNYQEAVSGLYPDARYGTDPSPLWFTEPSNAYAFTARFYAPLNANAAKTERVPEGGGEAETVTIGGYAAQVYPFVAVYSVGALEDTPVGPTYSALPYEMNEGYDTDGDGTPDIVEVTHAAAAAGDPQSQRTPDRQYAAYFDGTGVMQSQRDTRFGPNSLRTFTVECWVKPDANASGTMIVLDRPWRFDEAKTGSVADIRHNFQLGLEAGTGGLLPFARFTSTATAIGDAGEPVSAGTPLYSPTVKAGAGSAIVKETDDEGQATVYPWTHLAVTFDGATLTLYVNGTAVSSQKTSLEPATGVISLHATPQDVVTAYTYRRAPLLIGGTPKAAWAADPALAATDATVGTLYDNLYKGYVDEVRIWNGARTESQIVAARTSEMTSADMLQNRLEAFLERYSGNGFYQAVSVPELLAYFSFNDLPAGPSDEASANAPWEKYPGEKTVGGADTAGSYLARRKALETMIAGASAREAVEGALPSTVAEVFTSPYGALPAGLKSDFYKIGENDYEFAPVTRNGMAQLPLMDMERGYADTLAQENLVLPIVQERGTPPLRFPSSGSAAALTVSNLKPTDSVYWTPFAAGGQVTSSVAYPSVRTTGNPYADRYVAAITFDPLAYAEYPAYSTLPSGNLTLFGNVFAKFDPESWTGSPTSNPEVADPGFEDDKPGADGNGLDWFEKDPNGTGSKGDEWLDANIANGAKDDADDDGMPSWWESYYGLDPNDPEGRNGPHGDNDGDFLTNYAEYLARSNPEVYSTAGNGVPDYQIPIWARRGRPTFGLLYTDNDFMEDHWEALYRHAMLTVDRNDAAADPDGDGWSNYAELRATVRGVRGTDPLASVAQTAPGLKAAYPTPVLLLEPAIFENLPADATTKDIVVQAYTAENNDSTPDATYVISLDSASGGTGGTGGTDGASAEQLVGSYALDQTVTGYLQPGNIVPGSLTFTGLRYIPISNEGDGGWTDDSTWTMRDNGAGALCAAYVVADPDAAADATGEDAYIISEMEVGTIDYLTGAYAFRFDSKQWTGGYVDGADISTTSLRAAYRYNSRAGLGSTFTLVTPTSGHLREGINNFFVFLDSNGDGQWNDGELAGVPDQHDVEVGWDKVTVPLRVTLTSLPPPGAIRVSLTDIANEIWGEAGEDLGDSENQGSSGTDTDSGSGAGSTGSGEDGETPRPPMDEKMEHELRIVAGSALSVASGTYGPTPLTGHTVFKKSYTRATAKPALTEDEIFAAYPQGLQGTESDNYVAVIYNVLLVPEYAKESTNEQAASYVVDTVTNYLTSIDKDKTVSTLDATGQFHNTDLVFTWKSNVQVPTFDLKIEKLEDGAGNTVSGTVFERTGIRGVGPAVQRTDGTYEYRYKLPRGIGEIGPSGVLFGNGLYRYTLTLKPYSGDPKPLTDTFRLVLKDSGRMTKEEPLIADAQDSFYVNLRVRYNGVLKERSDFGLKSRLVIEAHSSASFNGDPVASVSDYLAYDTVADNDDTDNVTAMIAANPYVTMTKDLQSDVGPDSGPAADAKFFSTCFDAELRALPDRQPVYLVAYLDLNGNGRRDAWEPWGYNTVGKDAANGFYFDPLAITPVKSGQTVQAEFYIQDVDTDNDKLADAWEWKQARWPVTDFAEWHGTYTGTAGDHTYGDGTGAIWSNGRLTAFGAQLFGVDMTTAEALGSAAADYAEILGSDLSILNGYDVYGLTVDTITLTPDGDLAIGWKMTADRLAEDGSVAETVDLSAAFVGAATSEAVYTVYGKAGLADAAWTKIGTVTVGSGETSATLDQTQVGGNVFFKVILTTEKKAVQTLAD